MKMMLTMMLAVSLLALSGCSNTWRGAGKDVERTGEKMQDHD